MGATAMDAGAQAVSGGQGKPAQKPIVIAELGEVVKSQEKKLAVRLMEFKGHRYLDVRMLNLEGQRWSYGHGITIGKRIFTQFLTLLNQEELELGLNAQQVEP